MHFHQLKKQLPKNIRKHLYSRYNITPEWELDTVDKVSAKTFNSELGFSVKILLAVKSPQEAAVIYRPNDRKTGYYATTWVNQSGHVAHTVYHKMGDLTMHIKNAKLYIMKALRRRTFTSSKTKPEYDILMCDETNKYTCERLCAYWEKIGSARARNYINDTKHWIAGQIVGLDSSRSAEGTKINRYGGTYNQRRVAVHAIESLELYEKNPYDIIHMPSDFSTYKTKLRYSIATYPYSRADDTKKRIKNMIHRTTLEKLRE